MDEIKTFSQYYFPKTETFEDNEKFRLRYLKTIEDFVNSNLERAKKAYKACRTYYGIDVSNLSYGHANYKYEEAFIDRDITDILDLVTILYELCYPFDLKAYYELREQLNKIILDESMCYNINEQGEVRYFPDKEFHKSVVSTLVILNQSRYSTMKQLFSDALDDLYKHRNHESPIASLFHCIETIVLTVIGDPTTKLLNASTLEKLFSILDSKKPEENDDDLHFPPKHKENRKSLVIAWVNMCHNYRHGKREQENKTIPPGVFNFLFSTGISILRFILELDNKGHKQ